MNAYRFKGVLVLIMALFLLQGKAQNARRTEVVIKTSVECDKCKKNIESKLSKVKGVRKVTADYTKHEVKVMYNAKRITLEEVKNAIANIGYDADDIKANNKLKALEHEKKKEGDGN
ncbi:MAG: heavy-metal-associated domain-containing protein [Bacteroidia bacterium]|nr:heavy-metal-associated domain-containing protein [Bacteroidia bacterium]